MEYELAKQLHDAGLEIEHPDLDYCVYNECFFSEPIIIHNPTFSELMSVLGDRFFNLTLENINPRIFVASGYGKIRDGKPHIIREEGVDPMEAMAQLCLALKGKEQNDNG